MGLIVKFFSEELVASENPKVQLKVIQLTNGNFRPITYGCLKFTNSGRFLDGRLNVLSSSLKREELFITKKELGSFKIFLQKICQNPHENFNSNKEYYKPTELFNKERFNNIFIHLSQKEFKERLRSSRNITTKMEKN